MKSPGKICLCRENALQSARAPKAPAAISGGEREALADVGEASSPTKNKHSAGPVHLLNLMRTRPAL